MKIITIDIETASDEDIKACGVYRYAESEFFDLLLVSYSIDGGAVATCDIANGEKLSDEILSAMTDKSIIKIARERLGMVADGEIVFFDSANVFKSSLWLLIGFPIESEFVGKWYIFFGLFQKKQ